MADDWRLLHCRAGRIPGDVGRKGHGGPGAIGRIRGTSKYPDIESWVLSDLGANRVF